MMTTQPMVRARGEAAIPALGLGTWRMGECGNRRKDEIAALQLGIDLGFGLIDTAEMYGSGTAEQIVGEAIRGRRDQVYLVSKVLPSNASRKGTIKAVERSLKHLNCDHIDLYLLHWPGSYPLEETFEVFGRLSDEGKIGRYGVSNFDTDDMVDAFATQGGEGVCVDQVLYNLAQRAAEDELMAWCGMNDVALMAYSPLDQGGILENVVLKGIADRHGVTAAAVAIAWTMRFSNIVSIPKATATEHVYACSAARDVVLTEEDLDAIDQAFPPPVPGVRLGVY